MPRGIERGRYPDNDLTREAVIARHQRPNARLVSQTEVTRDAVAGVRISNEMRRRAELEDGYGGGAGDWDD